MRSVTRAAIADAIRAVGIDAGDTVYLQTDLRTIGVVEGARDRESFCAAYLNAIFDVLGDDGTLAVPTYSTQVARFDLSFVWEETPTVLGTFSEYVRQHPDSLRSIHPLHSVTAIGRRKAQICAGNGSIDFGWDSPFHRLLGLDAKILTIGLESGYVVGIAHHLDCACGLPYVYNKLLKWVPIVGGAPVNRTFFASVRHLHLEIEHHLAPFVRHMRAKGQVRSSRVGGGWVHAAPYRAVFDEGAALLRDDPYFLLAAPPVFEYGVVPFDGPTAGRDGLSEVAEAEEIRNVNWSGYYLDRHSPGGDEDDL